MPWWNNTFSHLDDTKYLTCTIQQQIFCMMKIHEHEIICDCPVECSDISYKMNIVFDGIHEHNVDQLKQLGVPTSDEERCEKVNENTTSFKIKVTTAMVVLEEAEFELQEKADITPMQFVADVGGTAGFMLGMSIATLLAVADFMVASVYNFLYWLVKNIYLTIKTTHAFKRIMKRPPAMTRKEKSLKEELFANKKISTYD